MIERKEKRKGRIASKERKIFDGLPLQRVACPPLTPLLFLNLETRVDLNKQKAKYIDPKADPYDVLLDDFEKGMTSARLDEIFKEVREDLICLNPFCIPCSYLKPSSLAVCSRCVLLVGSKRQKMHLHP